MTYPPGCTLISERREIKHAFLLIEGSCKMTMNGGLQNLNLGESDRKHYTSLNLGAINSVSWIGEQIILDIEESIAIPYSITTSINSVLL